MSVFKSIAAGALLAGAALFAAQPALAQEEHPEKSMGHEHMNHESESMEGHSHEMCEVHGGEVTMTPHHHFETLFVPDGIRLYVYDESQKPVAVTKDTKAAVTLETRDGKKTSVDMSYMGPDEKAGRTQACLAAAHDFGEVKEGMMKAMFTVTGLGKEPITFKVPVTMMHETMYTCAMHPDVRAEDPGKCPQCGMAMTPVGGEAEHMQMHDSKEGMHHDDKDGN